ncbi:hypothetical protein [Bryobacter aggregatus]|uniref:hypothetical protein n=1 Tax=Bryobacter aggregatus TaxID=360054 RepID=UPI0004E21B47|nr:hypothetical protein [Bryobacter aggregatus]
MFTVTPRWTLLLTLAAAALFADEPYKGPVPEKTDLPYLRHANKLIPTDVGAASQQDAKNDTVYTVSGLNSTAKTPLTEPSFIVKVKSLNIQQMQLYKMETKGGQRVLSIPKNTRKNGPRAIRLSLDPLSAGLYKLEVQEALEVGEYCLSPSGDNSVYCFSVY